MLHRVPPPATGTSSRSLRASMSNLISGNSGGGSGGLKFSFYQAGKNYAAFTKNLYGDASADIQLYTSGYGTKLAPGTYYIKVQKYSYGNGYYKIRWK